MRGGMTWQGPATTGPNDRRQGRSESFQPSRRKDHSSGVPTHPCLRLAWLAVIPAMLMAMRRNRASGIQRPVPRLPPNIGSAVQHDSASIGPARSCLTRSGPRFDPTFRGTPGRWPVFLRTAAATTRAHRRDQA